eukprot:TRINITY_DN4938_c0_g1_i1.p1 TRINITY_DN4938_c0_g1~~TRINITY_DN4938_c0_g1_i1.p1  ORF type:complete len:370 (+),score=77.03 TRINITY_DN4938_c0_g1_i1:129-1112(+)
MKDLTVEELEEIKERIQSDERTSLKILIGWLRSEERGRGKLCRSKGFLPILTDILYSYSAQSQVLTSLVLKEIGKDVYITDELTELGCMSRLEYLRQSNTKKVSKAADVAVYYIRNSIKCIPLNRADDLEHPRSIFLRQELYKNCGVGYKLWPAAIVLARWICDHVDIFRGKVVVELGAGPGLLSMAVSPMCDRVIATDYLKAILNMLQVNAKENECQNISVEYLNWEEIMNGTAEPPACDVIVGSDLIYGVPLAEMLAATLIKMLKPHPDRIFFGVMQSNRQGVEEICPMLRDGGLDCDVSPPDEKYYSDISERNLWHFFTCKARV